MKASTELTRDNDGLTLNVAFDYGGREEILEAVRRILRDGLSPEQISEELFCRYLSTRGMPDPDLIVRTGGEMRLSNFLIWQSHYSEYYSTPALWPDFDESEVDRALEEFDAGSGDSAGFSRRDCALGERRPHSCGCLSERDDSPHRHGRSSSPSSRRTRVGRRPLVRRARLGCGACSFFRGVGAAAPAGAQSGRSGHHGRGNRIADCRLLRSDGQNRRWDSSHYHRWVDSAEPGSGLVSPKVCEGRGREAALATGAVLFTGGLLSYGILLRDSDAGREWVYLALGVIFASDTCALFVGRYTGRLKMAPSISPGKTWEGAAGGLAAGIGAGIASQVRAGL